jgi:hypothetical protein
MQEQACIARATFTNFHVLVTNVADLVTDLYDLLRVSDTIEYTPQVIASLKDIHQQILSVKTLIDTQTALSLSQTNLLSLIINQAASLSRSIALNYDDSR